MTHVFVAPHPDDVALSCGGLIASLRELGQNVAILTVFSGDGSSGRLTPYQREALGFGSKAIWPATEAFNRSSIRSDYPLFVPVRRYEQLRDLEPLLDRALGVACERADHSPNCRATERGRVPHPNRPRANQSRRWSTNSCNVEVSLRTNVHTTNCSAGTNGGSSIWLTS